MPLVGVVIGSSTDEALGQETISTLTELGISSELSVISAHRRPDAAREYGTTASSRGLEVIIAAAGGSAALPGVMASWSLLPVIGIPVGSSAVGGLDALYSIAQMPPGIPVACMAIGSWGARNAAYFAASILSLNHPDIMSNYQFYREKLSAS